MRYHRLFACLLFACVAASPVMIFSEARADEASHLKAAEDLLIATHMDTIFNKAIDQLLDVQIKQVPQLAQHRDIMKAFFQKYMSWDAIKDEVAHLYADNFTEDELKEISTFYQTPTGKKMIDVTPGLMEKGAALGQRRVQEHIAELQASLAEAVKKKAEEQADKQPQPQKKK